MATPPLWRIILHLYAFAQLGVLTRIVIGRLFSGECSGNGRWFWAPCVTGTGLLPIGGTLFYDFPANALGCFFIGLLSSGATLSLVFPQLSLPGASASSQLLFLPNDSSLQQHSALHIGLRTGYCGSLTTFSSWYMQVVILFVGRAMPPATLVGTQWPQALWAIFLGLAGAILGLLVGQHTALAAATVLQTWRVTPATSSDKADQQQQQSGAPGLASTPVELAVIAVNEPPGTVVLHVDGTETNGSGAVAPTPANPTAAATAAAKPSPPPPPAAPPPALDLPSLLADLAALASLLTLTGVSAAYAYLDAPPSTVADDRRYWWLAILFGPAGCVLRWYLSRFNTLPASWRGCSGGSSGLGWGWLQLGTYTANTLGCILDYVCEALQFRLYGSLSNTQTVCLQGLMVGTAGCLSTVSTWVMELQKLSVTSPLGAHCYFCTSALTAIVLGIIIFGIPAWTAPEP